MLDVNKATPTNSQLGKKETGKRKINQLVLIQGFPQEFPQKLVMVISVITDAVGLHREIEREKKLKLTNTHTARDCLRERMTASERNIKAQRKDDCLREKYKGSEKG